MHQKNSTIIDDKYLIAKRWKYLWDDLKTGHVWWIRINLDESRPPRDLCVYLWCTFLCAKTKSVPPAAVFVPGASLGGPEGRRDSGSPARATQRDWRSGSYIDRTRFGWDTEMRVKGGKWEVGGPAPFPPSASGGGPSTDAQAPGTQRHRDATTNHTHTHTTLRGR